MPSLRFFTLPPIFHFAPELTILSTYWCLLLMVAQFMKEQRFLVTCLMETGLRVTPKGLESEEMDGFLNIHHGETPRSCNR